MATPEPLTALARLHQQPIRFEAQRALDQLYRDAQAALAASRYKASFVQDHTDLDFARLTAEGQNAAVELATRAGLQALIEDGRLSLYLLWPISGRYFLLPASALVSPFRFIVSLEGQAVAARAQNVGEATWRTGVLHEPDCHASIEPLATSALRVFATDADARATLKAFMQPGRQSAGPDSDEEVKRSIRRLREERSGSRLPVHGGVALLQRIHGRTRSDLRRLLIDEQGRAPPGRPRKTASKEN